MARSAAAALKTRAAIFAALGDETRLSVLGRLSTGTPQSISRLTEGTRLSRQAVTKHLRVLEMVGVVRSIRTGRENLFELEPTYTSLSPILEGSSPEDAFSTIPYEKGFQFIQHLENVLGEDELQEMLWQYIFENK